MSYGNNRTSIRGPHRSDMDSMLGPEGSSREGGNAPLCCICRKRDSNSFTIGCNNCNELFHGHCMNVTEKTAQAIGEWYCMRCGGENPSLEVKYHSTETCEKDTDSDQFEKYGNLCSPEHKCETRRGSKEKHSVCMCGECEPCKRTEDCGQRSSHKRPFSPDLRKKAAKANCVKRRDKKFDVKKESRRHDQKRKHKDKVRHNDNADKVEKRRQKEKEMKLRQCLGPSCVEAARLNSKYCSEYCGMKLAADRIRQILPQRIQQWRQNPCVAEELGRQRLERIHHDQRNARLRLNEMERRFHELEGIIADAKQQAVQQDEEVSKKESEDLHIACVSCGHAVNSKVALRHMQRCYAKYECQTSFGSKHPTRIEGATRLFCDAYDPRSETYCKRLEVLCPEHSSGGPRTPVDEVCGCPAIRNVFEPNGDHCGLSKRKCSRHYNWEKLRRAEVDLERVRVLYKLEELAVQEHHVQSDMRNRTGLLPLLLHQTIQHDPSTSDLRSNKDGQPPAPVPHAVQ